MARQQLAVAKMRQQVVDAILDRENSLAYVLQWHGEENVAELRNAALESERALQSLRMSSLAVVEKICRWRRKVVLHNVLLDEVSRIIVRTFVHRDLPIRSLGRIWTIL